MALSKKEKSFLQALGKRTRTLRHDKDWSQETLAFRCGLHRTYVGSVERGERNISSLNLKRIADALDVPVSHLFEEVQDS